MPGKMPYRDQNTGEVTYPGQTKYVDGVPFVSSGGKLNMTDQNTGIQFSLGELQDLDQRKILGEADVLEWLYGVDKSIRGTTKTALINLGYLDDPLDSGACVPAPPKPPPPLETVQAPKLMADRYMANNQRMASGMGGTIATVGLGLPGGAKVNVPALNPATGQAVNPALI